VDQDDLSSEWATLKEIPGVKTLSENVDLRAEYMTMGEFPAFVYRIVDADYGFRHMAVWRYKCLGQKTRGKPLYHRKRDCWVCVHDVIIWRGVQYKDRERDVTRAFYMSKDQGFASLAELAVGFAATRDKLIVRYQEEIKHWRAEAAKLEESARGHERDIKAMAGLSLESTGKHDVPDTTRSYDISKR